MAPEALMRQMAYEPVGKNLPTMFDLPSENPEEPGLPDIFHPLQAFLLSVTLRIDLDFFTALDLNLYYDEHHPERYKRPDWFMVLDAQKPPPGDLRRSYVIWQEKVRPFMVVELISPGSEPEDLGYGAQKGSGAIPTKWHVYEKILRVPYYIVFDRYRDDLIAHSHNDEEYAPHPTREDRIWIPELSLYLGKWNGTYQHQTATWLRWFDKEGTMIPTPEEGEIREREAKEREQEAKEREREAKEREREAKDRALAKIAELSSLLERAGIDPEQCESGDHP